MVRFFINFRAWYLEFCAFERRQVLRNARFTVPALILVKLKYLGYDCKWIGKVFRDYFSLQNKLFVNLSHVNAIREKICALDFKCECILKQTYFIERNFEIFATQM